jgi:alkylated DNA nucleotide flippase Atl1
MKASFHEAWVRVANSSSEVKKLEKDIKELKKLLNQKGIAASKFGKYRK